MNARPYAPMKIEELEELARANRDDASVLRRLVMELRFRKNPRARRLKLRLEESDIPLAETISVSETAQESRRWPTQTPTVAVNGGHSVNERSPQFQEAEEHNSIVLKYEALRVTFTVEGEVLARWGMTPALPHDLQELVFQEWRKRFAVEGDKGRALADAIASDRQRISREREALQNARKALGITTHKPAPPPVIGEGS